MGFFGLGRSNLSLLECLPLEKCKITLRCDREIDKNDIPSGVKIDRIICGEDANKDIDEDILFFSPSVKRDRVDFIKAKERGVTFSSDAELFLEENKSPLYAITGSDGKSTTATLTQLLLQAEGKSSRLLGNIGEPMTKELNSVADCFVLELSSFMLEYAVPRSKAACITNITPNHLDWHGSLEDYRKAKLNIAKIAERLIVSDDLADISGAYGIASISRKYKELKKISPAGIYITAEGGYICRNGERLIKISDIRRREEHNIKNFMLAIAMTDGEVRADAIGKVASDFSGLRHRCELFLSKNGVDFIDSSIDSTPARTVQTLKSLDRQVVIILGGRGKGLDYSLLLPALKKYARVAIITGENAREIYGIVGNCVEAELCTSFEEAIFLGYDKAKEVGALLLSPASTSYDSFKNFEKFCRKCIDLKIKVYKTKEKIL